ncbi:uncharacterized protein LOC143229086 isoform X1 [Tachypleus tridentatus]|uniref:uncharacterized protein LOC143229086 isoform X1 n=1 Tax=Tachypleus tridentatus TaxID=6853 RepID=UPI003FD0F05B
MGSSKSSLLVMPPEVRELHIAVMRNDVAAVQSLTEKNVDVNYPWQSAELPSIKDGSTPLCEAVSLNHRLIIEVLLQAGAEVNKPDSFGCTPLHKAAYHGRAFLTEMLIASNADVHLKDHNVNTPLHICVQNALVHNNTDTVRALLRAKAEVNNPNRYGKIALHYAALWGLGEITEVLIKVFVVFQGHSEIDHMDLKWRTPLYCCIRAINVLQRKRDTFQQHLPAIKVLIMSGCDPLNLSSWLRKYQILTPSYHMDEGFYKWYISAYPESLKHLCRQAIQQYLGYHDDNAVRIRVLPLPKTLIDYLSRKLL